MDRRACPDCMVIPSEGVCCITKNQFVFFFETVAKLPRPLIGFRRKSGENLQWRRQAHTHPHATARGTPSHLGEDGKSYTNAMLKLSYAKHMAPRGEAGSSDSEDELGEEIRAEKDLHRRSAPRRSSYTAQRWLRLHSKGTPTRRYSDGVD